MDPAQEALLVHGKRPNRTPGPNGGGADLSFEDRHFSNDLAASPHRQLDLVTVLLRKDLDLTLLDDVHAVPGLTLANQDLAVLIHTPQPTSLHRVLLGG